ncbi:MAG: phage baseplate assembly protein V [Aeromonas sp.]
MSEFIRAEVARLLNNVVRVGVIAEVDSAAARARVRCGELLTHWLPFTTARAAGCVSRWDPVVGEQVVLLAPGGNLDVAIIGASLYSHAGEPDAIAPQHAHLRFSDGAVIEYDPAASALRVSGVKTALVQASHEVTLDVPRVTCTGDVTINGALSVAKAITGQAALSLSGELSAGGAITAPVATIGGIAVTTHRHRGVKAGGDTSEGPL